MRSLFAILLSCVVLAACKKPSTEAEAPAAASAQAAASATPEPTPSATPINLNAQAIVFCYHRFEEKPKDALALKPEEFERQMQALKDAGITVIPMADFLAWRRGEKGIPAKSAVISIDDGYMSGYSVAWPILKKFGYPFTMFIYTDYVRGGPKSGGLSISWEQLAEMRDAGVDIQSHTVSHSSLIGKKGKSPEQYREWLKGEILGSKQQIEEKLGIQVRALAYPYGQHNEVVREVARESGYEAAFTVYGQRLTHGGEPTTIGRYAIESTKPDVFDKAVAFAGPLEAGTAAVPAAVSMVTQPADGETVTVPNPEIKANLATLGNVDPKSPAMRISGVGLVPASYDPQTKTISYKLSQKLYNPKVTVIISAVADGRKIETHWSFTLQPGG